MDFRISGFRDFWISGFPDFWISGFLDFRISGSLDFWISWFPDFWISGFLDFWISGFPDFWISGFLDIPVSSFCHPCIWPSVSELGQPYQRQKWPPVTCHTVMAFDKSCAGIFIPVCQHILWFTTIFHRYWQLNYWRYAAVSLLPNLSICVASVNEISSFVLATYFEHISRKL